MRLAQHLSGLATVLAMVVALPSALAADRALLIGVGKYENPSANLPGVDLDIAIMKEVAEGLGFSPANIKTLMDGEATLANVRATLDSWLIKGTGASDRVLIYYSGHGAPVPDESGDESDGVDETLTMHDVTLVTRNGRKTLSGVMLDDEFGQTLARLKSDKILVLVDACHSGTVTKSFRLNSRSLRADSGVEKFFSYEGMPLATRGNFAPVSKELNGRYIAVLAAGDDEKSIATARGSVFTLGIKESLILAKENTAKALTPRVMHEVSSQFVANNVPADRLFHPQLAGNPALADASLRMMQSGGSGKGPVWRKVEELAATGSPMRIAVSDGKATHYEGDKLLLSVAVPQAGYLNIINVGPDDVPTVLFPNEHHPDNQVRAETLNLPTERMNFDLVARAPFGNSLTVAVLSQKPINLYQSADGNRDAKGNLESAFGRLSEDGLKEMRSYRAETRNSGYVVGKLETRVCRNAATCQ